MDLEDFLKLFRSLSVKCIEQKEGTFPNTYMSRVYRLY